MLKKIILFFLIISLAAAFASCREEESVEVEEKKDCWAGQYVMIDEETQEFKILTVAPETETLDDVVLKFKSVRSDDEFTALLKTSSKKYGVCNAGDRSLKFNLKSSSTVIAVDDMWTNHETKRNENWSGKYVLLDEGEVFEKFGDKAWNGEYICEESGLSAGIYAIKESLVLLTYTDSLNGEKVNLKCNINPDDNREAVYEDESRRLTLSLKRSNRTIDITDAAADKEAPVISGRYTR